MWQLGPLCIPDVQMLGFRGICLALSPLFSSQPDRAIASSSKKALPDLSWRSEVPPGPCFPSSLCNPIRALSIGKRPAPPPDWELPRQAQVCRATRQAACFVEHKGVKGLQNVSSGRLHHLKIKSFSKSYKAPPWGGNSSYFGGNRVLSVWTQQPGMNHLASTVHFHSVTPK